MLTKLKDFKSPQHKIFKMLLAGREKWKAKHHEVKSSLKRLENRVRAVTKSRENWRQRALEAERELRALRADQKKKSQPEVVESPTPQVTPQATRQALIVSPLQDLVPQGATYPLATIQLSIAFVLQAGVSLRGAEACVNLVFNVLQGKLAEAPTHTTIQNWILRLGLHELQRRKEGADDWVWIVDHTVQIGAIKCLLVMGIRASHWRQLGRPLEHHDLQVLELKPIEQSTGAVVHQQFQALAERHGMPLAVLSDQGSDIKKGLALWRAEQPETNAVIGLSDIAHKVASVLRRILEKGDRWAQYTSQCGKTKSAIQQTKLAHLIPPKPRSKARYMNIAELVNWGTRTGELIRSHRQGSLSAEQQQELSGELLDEKLGWLDAFESDLLHWQELSDMGEQIRHIIRTEGYHAGTAEVLHRRLPVATGEQAAQLRDELIAFVASEGAQVPEAERLPGSSEVIESLIGKGKRLEGQQSRSGFTRQVLAMAGSVVKPTREAIQAALKNIHMKTLKSWCADHLPRSIQSKRRRDLGSKKKEQKPDQVVIASTPMF